MVAAQHLPMHTVDAYHLITNKVRLGPRRQLGQIKVYILKPIMPRHIAGQHPRVRRIDPIANQGQSTVGQGPQGQLTQHTDMAVPAADEDDVAACAPKRSRIRSSHCKQ
jgi:hypothetical protein